jgi:hypothetical protein
VHLRRGKVEDKHTGVVVLAENIKEGKTVEAYREKSSSVSEFIGTKVS